MANATPLAEVQNTWNQLGRIDPLWAVLSLPDKRGRRWKLDAFLATGVQEVDLILQRLEFFSISVTKGTALDFGCGVGRLTQALARRFAKVHGVDIAASMLEVARQYNRHGDNCIYHLNASNDLRLFRDNSFDLVCSCITLQHMPPECARAYLGECLRVLGQHGALVFDLPTQPRRINVFKQWLVGVLGYSRVNACHKMVCGRPVMEMHATAKTSMIAFLKEKGAGSIHIDEVPGGEWVTARYYVTKQLS